MNHQSTAQNYIDYAVQFGVRSEQNGDRSGKADRHMKRKHLLPTMEAVQDPLARYRRHLEAEGKSINTIDSYCRTVNFFVRFMSSYRGRTFQPQHFSALNLALFLSYLRKVRGCQESTIRMRMSALASYGKFLVKIGLLTSNPVLMLRRAVKKSCSKRNQSDLNYQKLTRFLRAKTFTPNALRNLLIVTLQYQMDLTAVEMSQLLLDDVVWSRKLPKGLLVGQGAARRFILLKNKLLIKALNLYIIIRKLQIGTRLIKGRSGQEQGLSPTSIHRVVKTAWQQVGLGAFRPWSSQPVIDDNIGGRQTRLDRSIPDHNAA